MLKGKGEVGRCTKPEFDISTGTVPKTNYGIDKTYTFLSERDSKPHISRRGIDLTSKNLKTYVLICLCKGIKCV